ncbi:hypothetical protein HanHA300_Chr04g0120041 [Helianthus annuus]|nr:hypothetical protein HanHA300_Chr04g0120041 [Helianthus annuus]KAJ0595524.1 hypothetical protein HanHA89_Chr04g0132301 [Helianthus annuus]
MLSCWFRKMKLLEAFLLSKKIPLYDIVKGSSDEFTDANVQLALAVVRKLQEIRETRARIVTHFYFYFHFISFSSFEVSTVFVPNLR